VRRQQCRHSVQIEKQRRRPKRDLVLLTSCDEQRGFASSLECQAVDADFPLQIAWQRLLRNAFQGEPEFDAGNIASMPQSDAVS